MRRFLQLTVLLVTTGLLIATSSPQQRAPCGGDAGSFHAKTSCGRPGDVTLVVDTACALTLEGAAQVGLPGKGQANEASQGFTAGFFLEGPVGDLNGACGMDPADGGFAVDCSMEKIEADGGSTWSNCVGALEKF